MLSSATGALPLLFLHDASGNSSANAVSIDAVFLRVLVNVFLVSIISCT
jgi:hypothetical protein